MLLLLLTQGSRTYLEALWLDKQFRDFIKQLKLAIAELTAERIDPLDRSWVIVMSKKGGVDLDSILDQALDDFDEIETADIKRKALLKAERQTSKKNDLLAAQKLISSKDTQKISSKVVITTFT